MLSKIEQVEMLIALGKGDKYRLMNIRQSLESGKELFISDKDFLQDLIKTHLGDKIYQARVVSISEKPNLFCEECGSEISTDEKFCVSCGTQKPESSSPTTLDVPEPTPEPETKPEAGSGEQQASGGFAFTADGDIGESSTKETARESLTKKISELETKLDEQTKATRKPARIKLKPEPKKKSRQQELEEYEKKHLGKSETKVSRKTYKVKATRKIAQIKPKPEPKKKSRQQELGEYEKKYLKESETKARQKVKKSKTRPKTKKEQTAPAEKTADSPKVEKEHTAPAEKPKASPKARKEVFSRYYRSPEVERPKVKKSKSKKPNPFCEECGSKIPAKDMFCTNCGAKR